MAGSDVIGLFFAAISRGSRNALARDRKVPRLALGYGRVIIAELRPFI
jgi:hypothetical protein